MNYFTTLYASLIFKTCKLLLSQMIRADLFFHLLSIRAKNTFISNLILKALRKLTSNFIMVRENWTKKWLKIS